MVLWLDPGKLMLMAALFFFLTALSFVYCRVTKKIFLRVKLRTEVKWNLRICVTKMGLHSCQAAVVNIYSRLRYGLYNVYPFEYIARIFLYTLHYYVNIYSYCDLMQMFHWHTYMHMAVTCGYFHGCKGVCYSEGNFGPIELYMVVVVMVGRSFSCQVWKPELGYRSNV